MVNMLSPDANGLKDARADTLRGLNMYSSTPCGEETGRGRGMDQPRTPAAEIDASDATNLQTTAYYSSFNREKPNITP